MRFLYIILIAAAVCSTALAQLASENKPLQPLNVNFMLRGYFYAGSRIADTNALGGFGPSDNYPKALNGTINAPVGKVALIALPDTETTFGEKYKGMKVLLVNATDDKIGFSASDSRLSIVQEALDKDGKWKPIEYLPSSWCGNSYHTVFLGPQEYWEFSAARYTGKFKTKLRFTLSWQKSESEPISIYSNEFDGSINTKQFTVQQGHSPTNIMDPYNN